MSDSSQVHRVVDSLFRHESGRLVSVLARIFGSGKLELAEDVVQDAFAEAVTAWSYQGVPDDPPAWLFRVAKNKALNVLKRDRYKHEYESDVSHYLESVWTAEPALEFLFSDGQILDDQLRMMFTCCHPALSSDSQIALALKTLCGFSIPEIAMGFLTSEENINKRLVRARRRIREDGIRFEVPEGEELEKRVNTVLETVYLLFNEGYRASDGADLIRGELCEEAIRLAEIMAAHPAIREKSDVYGLLALMQLNASRFRSRQDLHGDILMMAEQDRSRWDRKLIQQGLSNFERSESRTHVSMYHILAGISACHCIVPDFASTDWKSILTLYDVLLQMDDSPVVMLNRAVALAHVEGPESALVELERIRDSSSLKSYHLFYTTQAELYIQLDQCPAAVRSLQHALALASLKPERDHLQKRLTYCMNRLE